MEEYLSFNGWHFNKRMCDWAVSKMKMKNSDDGESVPLEPWDKARCDALFKQEGIETSAFKGYDAVYVLNMARSDFYGSSLTDEAQLALYVKDYLSDIDGYDGIAFTRFYADCIGHGMPIMWEDVL